MTVYACDQFRESVVSPICQRCGQYKRYHVDRPGTGVKQANSPQTSQIPPVAIRSRVIHAGWDGLRGDPETRDGGSVEGYLAAAREILKAVAEAGDDRIRHGRFQTPEDFTDLIRSLLADLGGS